MSRWSDEEVVALESKVNKGTQVTLAEVKEIAEGIGYSERSVASKLRALDHNVEKKSDGAPKWDENLAKKLETMVKNGKTDVEIAAKVGKTVKQVRGKALSMGLMKELKIVKQDKPAQEPKFNEAESAIVVKLQGAGKFIEEIAEATGKSVNQVRGKLLSLGISAPQRDKVAKSSKPKIYNDEKAAQVKAAVAAGKTAETIAKELDLNIIGLKSWLGKNKLVTSDMKVKSVPYTESDIATLKNMAEQGSSAAKIAEILGRSEQSVKITAGRNKVTLSKE